jgi:hypothetical protein
MHISMLRKRPARPGGTVTKDRDLRVLQVKWDAADDCARAALAVIRTAGSRTGKEYLAIDENNLD